MTLLKLLKKLGKKISALTALSREIFTRRRSSTMTEILDKSAVSCMQSFVDELVQQATDAGMIVNGRKTKEILFGSILKDPPLSVTLSGTSCDI